MRTGGGGLGEWGLGEGGWERETEEGTEGGDWGVGTGGRGLGSEDWGRGLENED